uniref:Uncharacterized protein n=1 Tax=Tanacetum cinerariifolium TaxID=118510 RepID=A0A6L2KG20_TANCI|nr:hypothetical protein [Tanacetum cinerariifolium]
MPNPEDITDPTTAMNMALALMAKTFKLNYSTLTKNNQRISSNPRNRQIAQPGMNMGQDSQMQMVGGNGGNQFRQYAGQNVGNLNGYNDVQNVRNQVIQHAVQNPRIQNVGNQNGLIGVPGNANKNLNGDDNLVATRAEADLDEIEKVNANCILMANLQQASTSGTQSDKAPVYDSNGPVEVHNYGNCYDNEIFNMFTQEEQYTELLEPIPEPHQVPQNDNNVISEVFSVEQSGRTVEQHPTNVEETCVLYDSLYNNLATEVEKVNTEISDLNKQLSMEKSIVSSLLEEKKKFKSDFKIREDELLDKQIQLDKKIKELDNILVKTGQSIQTIHILSPKPDSFYHIEQKMALGYQNPFYLKQAQQKQQRLYDGKVLLEKHDPPVVHDSEETLQLAQESRLKMKQLNKEIKLANYTKINHLSGVFVSQMAKSHEELYSSNTSKTANVSNPISIPNKKFSDDTTPSVARKFLNEVLSYAKENAHLKTTYKNLFDSISVTRTQNKLHNTVYENAKLRTQLLDKVSDQKSTACGKSTNTKFAKQSILGKPPKVSEIHALSKLVTSYSIPTPQGPKVMKNAKVIALGMLRINPFKPSREEKHVPNKVRESVRKKPITVSQPHNVKSKVVCATCKQCLTSINHDECLLNYVNGMTSRGKKQKANASINKKEKKQRPKVKKTKKVGSIERLASPKPSKPRSFLRWSPTERMFDQKGKIIASSESESQSDFSKGFQILLFLWQCLGTVHFEIDHVAAILGFGDLQWGNILITKITAFRRNACFVRNLEGVDLLKGNRSTNLYTINLYEMASASPICLMARASSTKSWLWHQRLSHLNFDTINDLAKNDLVFVLLKFKYHKEHLCPLCEQGKSKRASHPPKPVPNYRQRLHLLHMNLCGPMRIARINGKRKLDISFLYVFGALCYPKNDREDIGKFGAKGDIGFFIGYSADSCAFRVYNRRTKKTTETMNVLGLDLTYAPSTITTQQPTEGELDLLFEAMYNDYISGQSSTAPRTVLAAHAHQVRQAQMTSTSIADSAPTPTNSSYQATNLPNTSQDVDELNSQQQHV